jgi:CRP-like cAMP-binding protein
MKQATIPTKRNKLNSLTTLHHVPLLAACSKKNLRRIVAVGDEVSFKPGQTLIEEGQIGREAFIILKGVASIRRGGKRIASVGAGSMVGELALLDNGPRTASVVCDTEVDALVINQRHFHEILRKVPALTQKLLTNLASRVRELDRALY